MDLCVILEGEITDIGDVLLNTRGHLSCESISRKEALASSITGARRAFERKICNSVQVLGFSLGFRERMQMWLQVAREFEDQQRIRRLTEIR